VGIVGTNPVDVSGVGFELGCFEIRHLFSMREGSALLHIHWRISLPLAITAVVVGGRENHGLIGPQSGEAIVAPVGRKLRGELGMIFLRAYVRASVLEFSYDHIVASFV